MFIFVKIESWERYAKYLFACLCGCILTLGFLYVYFMNLAVLKTAERSDNLRLLSETKGDFQRVEADYITKLNQLDISFAKSLGFIEAGPDAYISVSGIAATENDYGQNVR